VNADFKFVAVLEAHKNKAFPHIHGFTNIWLHQREWSRMWNECKGGKIVWVERIESPDLSEYVSKQLEVARYVGKENLAKAYKEKRNHRTLWRSENLKAKFELTHESEWDIIKEQVYGDDGNMLDFWTKKGVWSNGQGKQVRKNMAATRSPLPPQST